jgi:hypothetical protein
MLEQLTNDHFAPHVGTAFRFQLDTATWVALELVEVAEQTARPALPAWLASAQPTRIPFSLVFRGPMAPVLPQHMYHVEHDVLGKIEDLFIVPIAATPAGLMYQAVFS